MISQTVSFVSHRQNLKSYYSKKEIHILVENDKNPDDGDTIISEFNFLMMSVLPSHFS